MRHHLITPKRMLVGLALLLAVLSFLPVGVAAAVASLPRGFVRAMTTPVSVPLKAIGDTIRPARHHQPRLGSQVDTKAELGLALQRIASLQAQLDNANEQIAMLSQIRQTAGMTGSRLVDARVSGFSNRRQHPVLDLTFGALSGVENRMAVVWGYHFVGVTENVGARHAQVLLITAPKTSMQVTFVAPTADPAGPRWTQLIQLTDDGQTFEAIADLDAPVQVGDLAHLTDSAGKWPPLAKGFVVGQVVEVSQDTPDPLLLKKIIVRPLLDLPRLNTVKIIEPVR